MSPHDPMTLAQLNELALTDAAATRAEIIRIFRTLSNSGRAPFIEELAVTANTRLRQAVARAVQVVGNRTEMTNVFENWLGMETDEFARTAIADALIASKRPNRRKQLLSDLKSVPDTYRYLYDRIRHRVLNAMPGAGLSVMKLKDIAARLPSDQHRHALMQEIDDLTATFARLQRAIDFQEEKARFELEKFDIEAWLKEFVRIYRAQWQGIQIRLTTRDQPAPIEGIRYLLEVVFGNLLDNGRQAIDDGGWIALDFSSDAGWIHVTISDSGAGLSSDIADAAFKLPVTTKGQPRRGRGLMEVEDAMRRLGGRAEIAHGSAGARVRLSFPSGP
jgi:signal transduction histidine kinase